MPKPCRPVPHRLMTPLVSPARETLRYLAKADVRERAVDEFETSLGRLLGGAEVAAVNSARTGLLLALKALGLPQGATVWLPVNSYDGLPPALARAGYVVAYVDIGDDFNMCPEALERSLRAHEGPGAVVATHMFGLPCALDRLGEVARAEGLLLIEDAAHAVGVRTPWGMAGTVAAAGVYSFQARKLVNALTGGAVTVRDAEVAAKLRADLSRNVETPGRALGRLGAFAAESALWNAPLAYPFLRKLFDSRDVYEKARKLYGRAAKVSRGADPALSAYSALLATAQLGVLPARRMRLERIWVRYDAVLRDVPGFAKAPRPEGAEHGLYMYVALTPDGEAVGRALWREGVGSSWGAIAAPCLAASETEFPGLYSVRHRALQLPFSDSLDDAQVERVARALERVISRGEWKRAGL